MMITRTASRLAVGVALAATGLSIGLLSNGAAAAEDRPAIIDAFTQALEIEHGVNPDAVGTAAALGQPPDVPSTSGRPGNVQIPPQATARQIDAMQHKIDGQAERLFQGDALSHAVWVGDRLIEGAESATVRQAGAGINALSVTSVSQTGDNATVEAIAEEWDAAWVYQPETDLWVYSAPVGDVSVHASLTRSSNGDWQVTDFEKSFVNGSP